MTISVRALGCSLLLSMEIILTILLCFKGFLTPGMTLSWEGKLSQTKPWSSYKKQLSATCLDFQSMVDIVFVQVMPVLLLLWHTWQAHYVSGGPKKICVFQKQIACGVRWFFTFVSLVHSLMFRPVNPLFIFLVPTIHWASYQVILIVLLSRIKKKKISSDVNTWMEKLIDCSQGLNHE